MRFTTSICLRFALISLTCLILCPGVYAQASGDAAQSSPRTGEILLQGVILDADPIGRQFTLRVSQVQEPQGKITTLATPRNKLVGVGETTATLHHGDTVAIIGPNSGSGKAINARLISVVAPAPVAGGASVPVSTGSSLGAANDASRVLTLISDRYTLGSQTIPQSFDLLALVPSLRSRAPGVREVAALAAVWEQDNMATDDHFKLSNPLGTDLVGMENLGVKSDQHWDPGSAEAQVQSALYGAINQGAILPYSSKAFWPQAATIFPAVRDRENDGIADAIDKNRTADLILAKMHEVFLDRAEALAENSSGSDHSRNDDLTVSGVFEKGNHWGTVRVTNSSSRDILHVTLSLRVYTTVAVRDRAGEVALGAVVAQSDGKDLRQGATDASQFLDSIDAYFEKDGMPIRVLVHLPILHAGETCEVPLFHTSYEFFKTRAAVYAVWADHVGIGWQRLPKYDEEIRAWLAQ